MSSVTGRYIKVIVDAATFDEHSVFGFLMVARNCKGELVQGKTISQQKTLTTQMTEIIKEALS